MPKIHEVEQRDGDWIRLRIGKVTASEASNVITSEFKPSTGAGVKTYLYGKLAEAYAKQPLAGFTSWATEQGMELEYEARHWLAFEFPDRIKQVGFVEHDDGRCGCSPDGLIGDDGGVEIKCPEPTNHVRYLIEGKLPKDYLVQVHFSLYVTGRKWWRFVSYRRRYPAFVLTVERDEAICAKIHDVLAAFYKQYDEAMNRLTTLRP